MAVRVSEYGFQRAKKCGTVMLLVGTHKAISLLLSDPKCTENFHCYLSVRVPLWFKSNIRHAVLEMAILFKISSVAICCHMCSECSYGRLPRAITF